jgi:monothiol glutaredoxin
MRDPVHERIEREISEHDVVLFMKGTPVFPQCGFSSAVTQVLSHLGVKFKGIDVLSEPALRQGIKTFSDWPTVPQLYVKASSSAAATSSARCSKPESSPSCWRPAALRRPLLPPDRSCSANRGAAIPSTV